MPLLTIVVPTFDRPSYLKLALQSVVNQTFKDFTVIVCDDASRDPTLIANIVHELGDARIELRRRSRNVGMARNIWPILAQATSKYVTNIHDDDTWEPEFLRILVDKLEQSSAATVAFCDIWHVDEDGNRLVSLTEQRAEQFGRMSLAEGYHAPFFYHGAWLRSIPAAMGAIFRHSSIDWLQFPEQVGTYYDEWLAYLAVREGKAVYYTPARLSNYRIHSASETGSGTSLAGRLRFRAQAEYLSRAKANDLRLIDLRHHFVDANRKALFGLAFTCALIGDPQIVDERLAAARSLHSKLLIAAIALLSRLPSSVAQRLLTMRR